MKNRKTLYLLLAACSLAMPSVSYLCAQDAAVAVEESHVSVQKRTLSLEQELALAKCETIERESATQAPKAPKAEGTKERKEHKANWYTTHTGAYQKILAMHGDSDRTVKLWDGSIWNVCHSDRETLYNWSSEDLITIMPYWSFFSNAYRFQLANKRTGEKVRANIVLGPIVGLDRFVTRIDYERNEISLNDYTVWRISNSAVLATWELNDCIMIGINDSFFSSFFGYSNILINISNLTHSNAKCNH